MGRYKALDIARWFINRNLIDVSNEEDKDLLEDIYSVFGKYSAFGLRDKTHMESPWLDATENGKRFNMEIPRESIINYFKENYVQN